jgi:tRNA-specific 2-thiouridylase
MGNWVANRRYYGLNKRDSGKVVVAMSGGVDSALASALLKREGWDVYGAYNGGKMKGVQGIAEYLDISLDVVDLRKEFRRKVIEPFLDGYLNGMTPNPCVLCNAVIKFEHLSRYAERHNIPYVATGHYAMVNRHSESGSMALWRGKDRRKEQSYFLHRLGQSYLSKAVLPLGKMSKSEVRRQAHEMGLAEHTMPESQEICFIPKNDYRLFLEKERGGVVNRGGNIVDGHGNILGRHQGIHRYTIGQREGLGIASNRPYYVKELKTDTCEVVVGRKEEIYSRIVEADHFNWIGEIPSQKTTHVYAQIRYRHKAAPGRLEILSPKHVRFTFKEPQWAVTPGQALVCYEEERLMGGGWIKKV